MLHLVMFLVLFITHAASMIPMFTVLGTVVSVLLLVFPMLHAGAVFSVMVLVMFAVFALMLAGFVLTMSAAHHMAGVVLVGVRSHRSDLADRDRYHNLSRLLEGEGEVDVFPLLQRLMQPHKHDVKAARLQHCLATGRNLNRLNLTHLEDTVLIDMRVQLGAH